MSDSVVDQVQIEIEALRARFERLRALRSAWSSVTPSGPSDEKQKINETERDLADELQGLAESCDPSALAALDATLDQFGAWLRSIALNVPFSQLRSTLPKLVIEERRGLLDLLDLMLGSEQERQDVSENLIGFIDYLITLLCVGDSGKVDIPHDPVTLTPRLRNICEQFDVDPGPRLREIEAEFFAATRMNEVDVREEMASRKLRRRKLGLDSDYFAPNVLRAVVTYNQAAKRQIEQVIFADETGQTAQGSAAPRVDGEHTGAQPESAASEEQIQAEIDALRARSERLRALRSAWGSLATSSLPQAKQKIGETGRTLGEELQALGQDFDASALTRLDARLDEFEAELRSIALAIPVSQLRLTLPECVREGRRGVLDLVDLILGTDYERLEETEGLIAALDYLITLLCSGDPGETAAVHDPVTLTPRLNRLCERSDLNYDPALGAIEAEFFTAAKMAESDVHEEIASRTLRQRKSELGTAYFAPRVLRAIVTYNVVLLQRIDEDTWDSQDWGTIPVAPPTASIEENGSVFDSQAMRNLAAALRRRGAGEKQTASTVDCIAWALDLAYTSASERTALFAAPVGTSGELTGTTILLGLLCRAGAVLEEELPAIGLVPSRLSGEWLREIEQALQQEVNQLVTADKYQQACVFSELKTKYLYAPLDIGRMSRERVPAKSEPLRAREAPRKSSAAQARELFEQGLAEASASEGAGFRLPWAQLARLCGVACATGLALVLAVPFFWNGDLEGYSGDELITVSVHLARGSRNGDGKGSAFVGAMKDDFFTLDAGKQTLEAHRIVDQLRARGVREIMIYDGDAHLRIQALGSQSVRVLAARPS